MYREMKIRDWIYSSHATSVAPKNMSMDVCWDLYFISKCIEDNHNEPPCLNVSLRHNYNI